MTRNYLLMMMSAMGMLCQLNTTTMAELKNRTSAKGTTLSGCTIYRTVLPQQRLSTGRRVATIGCVDGKGVWYSQRIALELENLSKSIRRADRLRDVVPYTYHRPIVPASLRCAPIARIEKEGALASMYPVEG